MRTRNLLVGAVVGGLSVLGAACTAPPTSAPLPACPSYRETVLSTSGPSSFSVPLAVSPDGGSAVTSETLSGQVVLTIRSTTASAPVRMVGTLPQDVAFGSPAVGVTSAGTRVVFANKGGGPVERWNASDGVVTEAVPPTVASPPGLAGPVEFWGLSGDGTRILWAQSFDGGQTILTTTDAGTDAVVAQFEAPSPLPGLMSSIPGAQFQPRLSSTGSYLVRGNFLVDLTNGDWIDLGPTAALVSDAYPNAGIRPDAVSDSGRYVVFDTWSGSTTRTEDVVLYDFQTQAVTPVVLGRSEGSALVRTVTDSGDVLLTLTNGADAATSRVQIGGLRRSVSAVAFGASDYAYASSASLRTVLLTRNTLTGYELVSERCT
jgi:hypothetical protein